MQDMRNKKKYLRKERETKKERFLSRKRKIRCGVARIIAGARETHDSFLTDYTLI